MMLIGLAGRAGSGKSSAAWRLVQAHGFVLTKFAGPLKAMLKAAGLNDRMIEGDLKEKPIDMLCGKTPRWAMQSLGTDWGRKMIGDDLWVRLWEFKVAGLLGEGVQHVVVDDVRFDNEARAIVDMGGYIFRITRPSSPAHPIGDHASEALADKLQCHGIIENDSTLTDFEATVDQMFVGVNDFETKRSLMQSVIRKETQE